MIDGYVRYTYHYSDMFYTRVWPVWPIPRCGLTPFHNICGCRILDGQVDVQVDVQMDIQMDVQIDVQVDVQMDVHNGCTAYGMRLPHTVCGYRIWYAAAAY